MYGCVVISINSKTDKCLISCYSEQSAFICFFILEIIDSSEDSAFLSGYLCGRAVCEKDYICEEKERSLVIQLFNALEYSNSMKVVLKIWSIILLDM